MRAQDAHARKGAGQGELSKRARQALAAVVSEGLRANAHSVDLNFRGDLWCRLHLKTSACKQAAQDRASGDPPDKGEEDAEMDDINGFAEIAAAMAAEQDAAAPASTPSPAPAASPPREAMQVPELAQPRGQKREAPVAPPERPADGAGGSQPARSTRKVDKNTLSACGHSSAACSAGVSPAPRAAAAARSSPGPAARGRGSQMPDGRDGGGGRGRGYAAVLAAAHDQRRSWETGARKLAQMVADERIERERAAAEETLRLRDAVDDAFERGRRQGAGGRGGAWRGRGWPPGVG